MDNSGRPDRETASVAIAHENAGSWAPQAADASRRSAADPIEAERSIDSIESAPSQPRSIFRPMIFRTSAERPTKRGAEPGLPSATGKGLPDHRRKTMSGLHGEPRPETYPSSVEGPDAAAFLDPEAAVMMRNGITRTPASRYHVDGYHYTSLADALDQVRRGESARESGS